MATTPEGKVKKQTSALLDSYGSIIYRFMPVQFGYGSSTLDYLMCVNGRFVAVETKAPGKEPTVRQGYVTREILRARGSVFIVDGQAALPPLKEYLDELTRSTDINPT